MKFTERRSDTKRMLIDGAEERMVGKRPFAKFYRAGKWACYTTLDIVRGSGGDPGWCVGCGLGVGTGVLHCADSVQHDELAQRGGTTRMWW